MKILCVIDSLCSGGSQRQIVELALGMKEMGHDVSFLTYHNIKFFDAILNNEKIPINCIEENNYLLRIFKMRRFIRKGKFGGVVAFLEGPSFICEVSGFPYRKWKLVISEGSANPNIFKSFRHILYRLFHLFADFVVANSYANMKIVQTVNPFLPNSKCQVIYNIIDFKRWKPLDNYSPRKDGYLHILVAARHQYLKNLDGLINAVSNLPEEDKKKLKIDWYGDWISEPYFDGSYPEGKHKIKELNMDSIFTFHSAINPITEVIQTTDVIGLFSYYEGFPNVVSEGMACGKPIVCTAVSDLPDILGDDKNLLCNPASSESIKKSLMYLIHLNDEELIHMGEKNELIAKELFYKEENVKRYIDLLK
jgi:glycosyltransferase involved in cell wall biosynthesis